MIIEPPLLSKLYDRVHMATGYYSFFLKQRRGVTTENAKLESKHLFDQIYLHKVCNSLKKQQKGVYW